MKIGVSIDGVLRNFLEQVKETHLKYFPTKEGESEIEVSDYELEKWITFPEEEVNQGELDFNPDFNEESFLESKEETELTKVKDKVTLDEFLYERCTVEIFGYAEESISSAVETLNQLILDNPRHEFILISREGGMAIPSTLFFLAKTKSTCPNIKFVTEYSKVWDYVDVMVTDHPKIINTKPIDKLNIVIDKEYNKKVVQPGHRIKTIKEVDERLLDNIEQVYQNSSFV
tara:strand:- start:1201 stop:1890 length:690 start_codon:yes stop_codon:yes gene_type:complete